MKKIISIVLLIVLIFSISACNKENNTSSELNTDSEIKINSVDSSSQNNTTSNENPESKQSSSQSESNKEDPKPDKTNTPSTHTHSFSNATCTEPKKCSCGITEGSALGHKWQDATCKMPKTCSVCKVTDGNVSEHKYENFVCVYCDCKDEEGIAIATNPKLSFKPGLYTTEYTKEYLKGNILTVHTIEFGSVIYFSDRNYDKNPSPYDPSVNKNIYIEYDNEKYYSTTSQGGPCEHWHYELTDEYVIVYEDSIQILKCTLNIDDTLTIVESKYSRFIKGTILK